MALSESCVGRVWLSSFPEPERELAAHLMDAIMLVDRDEFANTIHKMIDHVYISQDKQSSRLALYAERPVKKVFGKVPAFFPGSRDGRAIGPGLAPIVVDPRNQEVGSEGIIAQLITDYCRAKPDCAISHPGPDTLRAEKVRRIVIVTDFIGSGQRIERMLESMRYVRSLRSWRSFGWLEFIVISFSGSQKGLSRVRRHKLQPDIITHVGCLTIDNNFVGKGRYAIKRLCEKYPKRHENPLGFGGIGALIAFSHGCPNNVPPILYSSLNGWKPLFAKRSTLRHQSSFQELDESVFASHAAARLLNMKESRANLTDDRLWISTMLVLEFSRAETRNTEDISARIRLSIQETETLIGQAVLARWLGKDRSLTALGRRELERLRKRRKRAPVFTSGDPSAYYPTQLRVP